MTVRQHWVRKTFFKRRKKGKRGLIFQKSDSALQVIEKGRSKWHENFGGNSESVGQRGYLDNRSLPKALSRTTRSQ